MFMGIIPVTFTDCCRCKDPGPDKYFSVDSMNVTTQYDHFYGLGFDSTAYYPFDSIGFIVSVNHLKQISSLFSQPTFSFITSAYACSCNEPNFIIQQKVASFEIISKVDSLYNDEIILKRGDVLNTYFNVDINGSTVRFKLEEYQLTNYFPGYSNQSIQLYLNVRPKQPVTLLVDIIVKLNDGKVFLFENQSIKVK
jgi:hypothetical protein